RLAMGFEKTVSIIGPAIGVEGAVADELIADAVEIVGPRLGDDIENAAARAAKLGGVGGRLEAKLGDRLEGNDNRGARMKRAALAAIGQHAVLRRSPAAHFHNRVRVVDTRNGATTDRLHTGHDRGQRERIASRDRKLSDGTGLQDVAESGGLGFELHSRRLHLYRLADLAYL